MFGIYAFLALNVLLLVFAIVVTRWLQRKSSGSQKRFSWMMRAIGVYAVIVVVANMMLLTDSGFTLFGNLLMSIFSAGIFAILFGSLIVVMDMVGNNI